MGNIIFAAFFLTFGIFCIVTPETMLKYRSGLKKNARIKFEWYWKLLIYICGISFILVGIMTIADLFI